MAEMRVRKVIAIGDVVRSREIAFPESFHNQLTGICEEINEKYRDSILADLKILKGKDEIGIVFSTFSSVYEILSGIAERILPVRIRFAIAYGLIDTAAAKKDVSLMDGPVFHQAALQMAELKKRKNQAVDIKVFGDFRDLLLEGYINLLFARKSEWSDHQRRIIDKYREGQTQKSISEFFGITQQAVSLALKSAQWHIVNDAEAQLSPALKDLSGELIGQAE